MQFAMEHIPLSYKFVAAMLMLHEINYCAGRLKLPISLPIKESEVKTALVFDPHVCGFSGRIDTDKYMFGFNGEKLKFITRIVDDRGDLSMKEYNERRARRKSVINTEEAYVIATNWLAAVEVDVNRLEKTHHPETTHRYFLSQGNTQVGLPEFEVRWGPKLDPSVRVLIAGDTKQLLFLRQEETTYSTRPATLIKNLDKLLTIPDEEFLKYSATERSNLVARFSAVTYPPAHQQTKGTNAVSN